MDKDVKLELSGRLAELMVNILPQIYRQHLIYDMGRLVLYATLKKALYSSPKSELMLYEQLVADMIGKGFELNPYDPCVTNKTIGGKQMTAF